MSSSHAIEYSKSSRAKCKGPPPCHGSSIDHGVLRYGVTIPGDYGETVEWRHWGCVTPEILGQLASVQLGQVLGFDTLAREDQAKIRRAISSRRVNPTDIPESAKHPTLIVNAGTAVNATNSTAPAPTQKKRKALQAASAPASSSASSSRNLHLPQSRPLRGPVIEFIDDEDEVEKAVEEPRDELYCILDAKIVGVQYYNGMVGPGEEVRLVREPTNQYDRNAIQVKNISCVQIGHIPRNIAARMAPLMDRKLITVEGVMREGNLTVPRYSLSMTLKFYGASNMRAQLEPQLIWATPHQRGFPSRNASTSRAVPGAPASRPSASAGPSTQNSRKLTGQITAQQRAQLKKQEEALRKQQEALAKAAELRNMLNNLEKVDDEGRRTSLLDSLCGVEDVLGLPLHPDPPGKSNGLLVVDLLKHQSQALQWCVEREYPVLPKTETDKPVQFWQMRLKPNKQPYYYNVATKTPTEQPPSLGRGALCADSMGLGKTLTMIALILATKADVSANFSKSTLIVVPLSVMSNWEKQIEEHCVPGVLSSCVYYGATRSMAPQELMKYDVVITTYQTVAGEHAEMDSTKNEREGPSKKKKQKVERGLFDVQWKRIILDEGHNIRNRRTKMAKALCTLSAQRRWVLSGTPIINSPGDLGSILTFLQICRPLDNEDFYKRLLLRPLKDGDPAGAELLRALMSHICIRRTKEMQDADGNHLVPLPPVEMILVPVTLSDEARELYDAVEELSKQRFERIMTNNSSLNLVVTSNVLSMLTRMRQLALHPGLVPANYLEQLRVGDDNDNTQPLAIRITAEDKFKLQNVLSQMVEDSEECPICFSILSDPRITTCGHPFCLACITEVISRDPKCPMDRRPIALGDLIESAPPTELTQVRVRSDDEDDTNASSLRGGSSAKIDQLIHLLQLTPATEKSLVFSQFTAFLDKIAEALEEHGIPYVRFDGQMSARRRQETLERFNLPLEDNTNSDIPIKMPSSSIRSRRGPKQSATNAGSFNVDDDDDFSMNDIDGDLLDDDDDDCAFLATPRQAKGKGRSKVKGKAKSSRANLRASFNGSSFTGENPKVMIISLKAGALGLNLTVANNVYLMDPWWQEGIESQAIDRCNRIGQKKPVHVYQLIAENTVEAKVVDIQEKKKILITQAFSGIKRVETQRQKKEARLQDLIELFGVRQQAASQRS